MLYTTHRTGPLAAKISASPVIDMFAQAGAPEDCPLGPFVHEEEELEAPTPSKFPVSAVQPGSLMVVHEGQVGGTALVDTVDPPLSSKFCDGMWQAPTPGSLTRVSWANRGFCWPTQSARRSTGALANKYVPRMWWG